MSMIVTSDQCDPFTVNWEKSCNINQSTTFSSLVNIGITSKGNDLVNEGKLVNQAHGLVIPANVSTITFYISSMQPILMNAPKFTVNEDLLFSMLLGELSKGSIIDVTPGSFTLALACAPLKISKSDVQINFSFENKENINFIFTKECDTTTEIEQYFNFLTFLYWIFVFLITILIFLLTIYYLQKNEISLFSLFDRSIEYVKFIFNRRNENAQQSRMLNEIKEKKLMEEDLVDENLDINITNTKYAHKSLNGNEQVVNIDYGGI